MPAPLPMDDDWRATHYLQQARQDGECLCLGTGRYYPTWHCEGRRTERIAELVCRVTHGPQPSEQSVVALTCVNKGCISPDHVYWGTQSQSIKQAFDAGHVCPPEGVGGHSKLSQAEVETIRRRLAAGERQVDVAKDVGVSFQHVSKIKLGLRRAA